MTTDDDAKLDSSAPHVFHPERYAGPFKDW